MALPYFFVPDIASKQIVLDEQTSKHVIQVLRMKKEEELLVTDGRGARATAVIIDDNRKRCLIQVLQTEVEKQLAPHLTIAISLVKNAARFEWFLEKATEIGVNAIIPLLCERTEKEKFRHDRLNNILISAMLQSQQCWMPELHHPVAFDKLINETPAAEKLIAHCLPEEKQQLVEYIDKQTSDPASIILIGPEGDFTESEISLSLQHQFIPVALGNTRLRTETAGMVAATLLRNRKAIR